MAIPDYQQIMLPLLNFAGNEKEHTLREAIDHLTSFFKLTEEERKELLPSETQNKFNNRVAWARSYMKQAGLVTNPTRGVFKITPRGKEVLASKPPALSIDYLMRYPEFIEFKNRSKKTDDEVTTSNFSKEAADYVAGIDSKIVLIDGDQLAQLMIDFDLRVSKVASYDIKKNR